MDVIITEKQKEKFKSIIKTMVEDINVPLASKINVEFSPEGYIFVFVLLKGWLAGTPKSRYESLARERVKNYIGLNTDVIILNDAVTNNNN
jgi:hypothetical protein